MLSLPFHHIRSKIKEFSTTRFLERGVGTVLVGWLRIGNRYIGPGFVVDECDLDLAEFIRGYPIYTYKDIGLEHGASDQKFVEHANYHGAIIVSRNKRDFRKEMRLAADRSTLSECFEGAGLVMVPDGLECFDFRAISRNLLYRDQRVTWVDVYQINLEVIVRRELNIAPEI